jgi:hypothetical protein
VFSGIEKPRRKKTELSAARPASCRLSPDMGAGKMYIPAARRTKGVHRLIHFGL